MKLLPPEQVLASQGPTDGDPLEGQLGLHQAFGSAAHFGVPEVSFRC